VNWHAIYIWFRIFRYTNQYVFAYLLTMLTYSWFCYEREMEKKEVNQRNVEDVTRKKKKKIFMRLVLPCSNCEEARMTSSDWASRRRLVTRETKSCKYNSFNGVTLSRVYTRQHVAGNMLLVSGNMLLEATWCLEQHVACCGNMLPVAVNMLPGNMCKRSFRLTSIIFLNSPHACIQISILSFSRA